jgi:D-tyrosyl-tRNA(Tyr) deacylase
VFVGVSLDDNTDDAQLLAEKTRTLRIFSDAEGRFNHSIEDVGGSLLVVSQFTLYADVRKGRRPNFLQAAQPNDATQLVDDYIAALRDAQLHVATGQFGAAMHVALVNDGPVTIILDSDTWKQPRRRAGRS